MPTLFSGRKELADWIVSPDNPMTARVAVNRIWYWLMGQGLVSSLDNFGTTGSEPSHPELLDYLASEFIHGGWDIKAMVKRIANSRVYQLAAEHNADNTAIDPDNIFVWRANRRRLSGEEIRDTILSVAGNLDGTRPVGSVIAKESEGVIGGRGRGISESTLVQHQDRYRSVFLPLARNVVPEILETFDLPDASAVQTQREATNVPSQSLFLLNNFWVHEQANDVANRLIKVYPGDTQQKTVERLQWLYGWMFGRAAQADEIQAAKKLLSQASRTQRDATAAWASLARGLMATAEFRYRD
jgi:hypothetical protein